MTESLRISGKKLALDSSSQSDWVFESRPGGWTLAKSSSGARRRFQLHLDRKHWSFSFSGQSWRGEWTPKTYESSRQDAGDSDLTAQFPGKVRKVLVQSAVEVNEGDHLILVEAMKMEFVIRAPFSGVVVEILVQEGQQLSPGDRLIDLKAGRLNE